MAVPGTLITPATPVDEDGYSFLDVELTDYDTDMAVEAHIPVSIKIQPATISVLNYTKANIRRITVSFNDLYPSGIWQFCAYTAIKQARCWQDVGYGFVFQPESDQDQGIFYSESFSSLHPSAEMY
jgi:hypothetical protein